MAEIKERGMLGKKKETGEGKTYYSRGEGVEI